ncbi:hypothetical protein, partial [Staphylococcus aureus]|uniref:hypothetical protein n=1 Tax=Staphylococcus aureus TaxID=1280 RepID=UPI0034D4F57D
MIGKHLGVPFISCKDSLFIDKALAPSATTSTISSRTCVAFSLPTQCFCRN